MISHLFPIDFSLLYLSISCPFLLSPENKSPDFHEADLVKAIEWFNHRERRYGKTSEQVTKA